MNGSASPFPLFFSLAAPERYHTAASPPDRSASEERSSRISLLVPTGAMKTGVAAAALLFFLLLRTALPHRLSPQRRQLAQLIIARRSAGSLSEPAAVIITRNLAKVVMVAVGKFIHFIKHQQAITRNGRGACLQHHRCTCSTLPARRLWAFSTAGLIMQSECALFHHVGVCTWTGSATCRALQLLCAVTRTLQFSAESSRARWF